MLRNENSISSVWRAGTKSCNTPDNGTAGSPPAPGQQETWLATRYSALTGVTAPEHKHLETQNLPGHGAVMCWGSAEAARCGCVRGTPCQQHSESQARIDLFQLTEMRGKDQDMLGALSCLTRAQLRALSQGCCISHPSTLGTAFGFLLKDTTEQRTCFVSLKLTFSTKGVLFASLFLGKVSTTHLSLPSAGKSWSQLLDSYSLTSSPM